MSATPSSTPHRRGSWRVVDVVVAGVLGVVGGFYLWGIAISWENLTRIVGGAPPLVAVFSGLWVLPGLIGVFIVRRPGAAVYVELVAAVLEALLGNQWGFSTVYYGLLEGLGAELVVAVLLYRSFGLGTALLAGTAAGATVGLLDTTLYYAELSATIRLSYIGLAAVSGTVICGLGAHYLTKALAGTGVLDSLASGREAERV